MRSHDRPGFFRIKFAFVLSDAFFKQVEVFVVFDAFSFQFPAYRVEGAVWTWIDNMGVAGAISFRRGAKRVALPVIVSPM